MPPVAHLAGTRVREHARFLSAFLRAPFDTGALAPSSSRLAARMVEAMDLGRAETVVEVGPGTGPFTRRVLAEIGRETLFLAVEINPEFAAELAVRYPRVRVVNDSVEKLPQHLAAAGRPAADCILSGLPWAAFSEEQQHRLLSAVLDSLRSGGGFATFAYAHATGLPSARRFRQLLDRRFSEVRKTPVVWRNLPPAVVYRCRK